MNESAGFYNLEETKQEINEGEGGEIEEGEEEILEGGENEEGES